MNEEELGQELDRWQLIARDLLELLYEYNPEGLPEYEFGIYQELLAMPEIHIRKDITEYKED